MEVNTTHAEHLAEFVARASYETLSDATVRELKIRVLYSLGCAISDYEGFSTRSVSQERAEEKFERLASPYADGKLVESIEYVVRRLEEVEIRELTERLGIVGTRHIEKGEEHERDGGFQQEPVRGPLPDRAVRGPSARYLGTKSLWGRVLTYKG